ncbi:MAG TPA: HPr family phosphocarrier protein [Puia sp.]|jgi:phosphotransferase system HPr (HPr) family protein
MITRDFTILAPEGMHARPATALVKLARQFQSDILLKKGIKEVKMNSLLNILSMGVKGGEVVTVLMEGVDETAAAEALDTFFKQGLKDW